MQHPNNLLVATRPWTHVDSVRERQWKRGERSVHGPTRAKDTNSTTCMRVELSIARFTLKPGLATPCRRFFGGDNNERISAPCSACVLSLQPVLAAEKLVDARCASQSVNPTCCLLGFMPPSMPCPSRPHMRKCFAFSPKNHTAA